MAFYSLILFPAVADAMIPGPDVISARLQQIGLAGDRIQKNDYRAGSRFLDFIMFMGCSPDIRFDPSGAGKPCTLVRLLADDGRILCRITPSKRPPRCPSCGASLGRHTPSVSGGTLDDREEVACPSCGASSPPWQLNWHRNAGCGRCLVEITDIYPQEAIPQQTLLEDLHETTGTAWGYFYMHY